MWTKLDSVQSPQTLSESRTRTDQTKWSLHPELFRKNNFQWGPPICISSVQSAAMILQLETGPVSGRHRCFSQQWGTLKGYANPPWCLVSRVLSQVRSQQTQVILVAPVWKGESWYRGIQSYWECCSTTKTTSTQPGHVPRPLQSGVPTTASHVAYLQQKFGGANLSNKVEELLLASWRSKILRFCNYHFKKWLGWCTE